MAEWEKLVKSADPKDTVTKKELEEIIGDKVTQNIIGVCAGEWRRNDDGTYTAWLDQTFDE